MRDRKEGMPSRHPNPDGAAAEAVPDIPGEEREAFAFAVVSGMLYCRIKSVAKWRTADEPIPDN